uniref:Uncharacterized protein n=1 Tax=Arundo donax TaxID=35708 RepID=A0A0A9AR53_ARUDO
MMYMVRRSLMVSISIHKDRVLPGAQQNHGPNFGTPLC